MDPLIWAAVSAFLPAGAAIGWVLRGRRGLQGGTGDWMARLAARDHELADLREQLAAAVAEVDRMQSLRAASASGELEARLHRAERELEALRARLAGRVDSMLHRPTEAPGAGAEKDASSHGAVASEG